MIKAPDLSENRIGIVAIGRNEGERLRICLESVIDYADLVVYVDSGSTDGSVAMARSLGVIIVELDMSVPFTAARARNEGFRALCDELTYLEYVQFVDGDCEVVAGWLEKSVRFLDGNNQVAIACGRRRERFPNHSVYNKLCDMEWDTPVGEAKSCGGDAMIRVNAFKQVGGYRNDLIAGEEPEMCVRIRAAGWKIWRLDEEMTLHDAAMTSIWQWWKRNMRAGYGYAQGAFLHGAPPERHWVRESFRAKFWGLWIPLLVICFMYFIGIWGLLLLLVYPLQVIRLALNNPRPGNYNWWRSIFLVLGKFPEVIGLLKFNFNRIVGKTANLIEYK